MTVSTLNNPDKHHDFSKELPNVLATDEAISAGVKYDLGNCKTTGLKKAINKLIISKIIYDSNIRLPD